MFDWWWKLLYNISYWINKCIDTLYKLFLFFAGAAPAEVNQELAGNKNTNILEQIFTDNRVSVLFLGFLGFAGLVFTISIIIGLVRSEWSSKDNSEGKIKVLKHSLKGFLLVFLIPTIFSIGMWATSVLLSSIVQGMAGTDPNEFSLAQKLYEICLPSEGGNGMQPVWTDSYSDLTSWGWDLTEFNYVIAYIGGIIILFIIGLAALNLVERIIDLVFLYVASPFIIAVSPLDEGNRLGIWKDLVIAKLLSVAGMIVCFYIYFLCMDIIQNLLTSDTFIVKFAYLLFAIGGALAARKGGLLISNLVGHNTALIEGQQAAQTSQVVGTGFRAGLGVIAGLAGGALHLLGAGAGAGKGILGGGNDNTTSGTGFAASSVGSAAGDGNVSNILNNSADTTFSGIQAAGQGTGAVPTMPESPGIAEGPSSNTPMIQGGTAIQDAPPAQIIDSGQNFATLGAASDVGIPDSVNLAATPSPVTMPADTDIASVMNSSNGPADNNGEQK